MTWTYDGDPADPDRRDEVRWLVGDTDPEDELVTDEEVELALTRWPPPDDKPPWLAGAMVADSIAAKYARKADRSIGSLSISAKQQRDHYRELAADLRMLYQTNGLGQPGTLGAVTPAAPILGGGGPTYLGGSPYMNPEGNR